MPSRFWSHPTPRAAVSSASAVSPASVRGSRPYCLRSSSAPRIPRSPVRADRAGFVADTPYCLLPPQQASRHNDLRRRHQGCSGGPGSPSSRRTPHVAYRRTPCSARVLAGKHAQVFAGQWLKELSSAKYTKRVREPLKRKVWATRVLVSDSRKLVFVHIQKTGGSTVHRLLQERIPDIRPIVARHDFAICGMGEIDDWDGHFKFAFVRNPWDRLVSWYSMVTASPKIPKTGNELWRYARDNSSTFEEFIYNCTDEVEIREGAYYSFAYNQLDYVTDENGNLLVDFIGRLETFDDDVHEVFDRIGVELETIPHKN